MKGDNITFRQLRYLLAVSEMNHFRLAAESCGVSQPSLSLQIQNLEEALGVRLLERGRGGVALTPVGREVTARARRVLDEVTAIADFTASAQQGLVGTIRMGVKPTLGPYLLPHLVSKLHRQHSTLSLYVREGAPRELERELADGVHDVVLAQLPVAGTDFVTERLFREPLFIAMAADHPLAAKDQIEGKDLKDQKVLSLSPLYHLHDQISDLCKDFGAELARDYEGTSLDALRVMVGMDMGLTFLPALYVRSEIPSRGEVVVRRMKGRSITRSIGLVWRKSAGHVPAYKMIAEEIRDVVRRKFKDVIVEA